MPDQHQLCGQSHSVLASPLTKLLWNPGSLSSGHAPQAKPEALFPKSKGQHLSENSRTTTAETCQGDATSVTVLVPTWVTQWAFPDHLDSQELALAGLGKASGVLLEGGLPRAWL